MQIDMYNLNIKTKTHENIQFKFLNLNKFEIFANERNTKAHNIDLQNCLFLLTNKILILQVIQAIKLYPLNIPKFWRLLRLIYLSNQV